MVLDEVDLDVSNEDPAHRRQHSVRAGLDRVKRTPSCQAREVLTQSCDSEQVQRRKEAFPRRVSTLGFSSSAGSQGAPRESPYTLLN